jgi:hypothetical protein
MRSDVWVRRRIDAKWYSCPVAEAARWQHCKTFATPIREIGRVLACHGVDLGKSADGVAVVR